MTTRPSPRSDACCLHLARHGRTALNAAGVLRGHLDPPLDDVGRQQAIALADLLDARDINLIIASPLQRAVATVDPLAAHLGLDVETDSRLIDRDYGEWAGTAPESVVAAWGSIDAAPGVEPIDRLVARAWSALNDAVARSDGHEVVLVSHEAVNQHLIAKISPTLATRSRIPQDNGCVNRLRYDDADWTVEVLNQIGAW